MASLDLTKLLPPRYRDKTIDTLLKNVFNRHLSKEDSTLLYGYVGQRLDPQPGDVYINEQTLERQLNQLTPVVYAQHGTENVVYSWPDLVQKLSLLGADYDSLGSWFQSTSYNFVPPIDLDKFCNFNEYFWIGKWIVSSPSLPYNELGIPDLTYVYSVFDRSNQAYSPEYYVVQRGALNSSSFPIPPTPNLTQWSDWALTNLWIHKDDAITFINNHPGAVGFGDLVQATRPIIEYYSTLRINTSVSNGAPSEAGTSFNPLKVSKNQPPLFDLYDRSGNHLGLASSIFYYQEGAEYPIDSVLGRRVAIDSNSDYIFEHSLVDSTTSELYFFKLYDSSSSSFMLKTIWRAGPSDGPSYVKYDSAGSLINIDKLNNYKNYYWVGTLQSSLPSWNLGGLPEYNVIEPGGISDWSKYNYWVHVSTLSRSELDLYVQATRPIIEFNVNLEPQLVSTTKVKLGELPLFNQLYYDPSTSSYKPYYGDAYLQGALFARIDDLPTFEVIQSSPEVFSKCLLLSDGHYYLQGLYATVFTPSSEGVFYGYLARVASFVGSGNGSINALSVSDACVTEVLSLTFNGSDFTVSGTVSGLQLNAPIGSPYTVSGITFTLVQGSAPFVLGDTFLIEILTPIAETANFYVSIEGGYRTLSSSSQILNEQQNYNVVAADPTQQNGTWELPPQLTHNVKNETQTVLKQGDLYSHFISIIGAQPALVGDPTGKNNWRLISQSLGLGGMIKQFDGDASLLLSTLMLDGISLPTLIEYARQSYEQLFSSIRTFVQDQVPQLLTQCAFTPPQSGSTIDPALVQSFKEYFNNLSPVVTSSSTTVDDFIARAFYDTTSSFNNLIVTLPYLGLGPKVAPGKGLDLDLNLQMLTHHDGHKSTLSTIDPNFISRVIATPFLRSPGQSTPGVVTAVSPPSNPYQGEFWFKASTGILYFFNVVSDSGEKPATAPNGAYTYDRTTEKLYQNSSGTWVQVSDPTIAWTQVQFDLIQDNLTLAIEQLLYDGCPPVNQKLNAATLQNNPLYEQYMQKEFEAFGPKYGSVDVYSATYDSNNPFTWNYSAVTAPTATKSYSAWQSLYAGVYGTSRPDLQPWIPAGFPTEASLLQYLINQGDLPAGTSAWSTSFWPSCYAALRTKYIANGHPPQLSVDVTTGALLPPYSTNVNSLFNAPPASAANSFSFGDLGPVELYWTKTTDYLYSQQKVYFKLSPLSYVSSTWGTVAKVVGGEYLLNERTGQKLSPSTIQFHGDLLQELMDPTWISATALANPPSPRTYVITCVSSDNGGIFSISLNGGASQFVSTTFNDSWISISFTPGLRGFMWGDSATITVAVDGTVTKNISPQTYYKAEGFNQIYVQYSRNFGQDNQISINNTLFTEWDLKLAYRCGGLINGDEISINSDTDVIDDSAYTILLKENKFTGSYWLDALRIQLVQKGSTASYGTVDGPAIGHGGTPGEDWIFRVDNFNPARTSLTWNVYDLNGPTTSFVALDGSQTQYYPWTRYLSSTGTVTYNAPFLITGLQNVVNFLMGYYDKLTMDGWLFNDDDNPILDPSTNRPNSFQLYVEKFLVQQFMGVSAGSFYVINPFSNKAWFSTPHGTISSLTDQLGLEQETVSTVLTQSGKQIPTSNIRVFRQDDITQLSFKVPVYTLHLLASEYEHVILFDSYSLGTVLIYDSFLGQQVSRLLLNGEKQSVFTGRIDFGGHYLINGQMKKNLERSVSDILALYDTNVVNSSSDVVQAKSLLGFASKSYFQDRGTTPQTEFRFWQGMIGNKGTNNAVIAFTNSSKYQSASLDEYWAYKLATYGDARQILLPELKVQPNDCYSEAANYLFLEADELQYVTLTSDGATFATGYDEEPYDVMPYDTYSVYTSDQIENMDEVLDPTGCTLIEPADESRWYSYDDLGSLNYFEAKELSRTLIVMTSLDQVYTILDQNGNPVHADCFELVDQNYLPTTTTAQVYYERGEYVSGSNPATYSSPKFERVNQSSIKPLDAELLNRPLTVVAYGPDFSSFSPFQLFDYVNDVEVKDDLIWWDPARGVHTPDAIGAIDVQGVVDPAKYNQSLLTTTGALNSLKPWGPNEVGTTWWNTTRLDYKPYADTKLYPDAYQRLAQWGSIADYSSVEVYEWVQSSVPPSEYVGDGEVAIVNTLVSNRTWSQRTVAWKYSAFPEITPRQFLTYQPDTLTIIDEGNGSAQLVVNSGRFEDYGIVNGTKIAGVNYNGTAKTDPNIVSVFGTAKVTSSSSYVAVGSSTSVSTPQFAASSYFTALSVEANQKTLAFRSKYTGQYLLDNEVENGTTYIKLTHVPTGDNQRLAVHDIPVKAGTKDTYKFDKLGLMISYVPVFGQADSWPSLGVTSSSQRITLVAAALGNSSNSIFVRSAVDALLMIPFINGSGSPLTQLDSSQTISTLGWVAWNDPTSNPVNGPAAPYNNYEAILGSWQVVGGVLSSISSDISARMSDPWVASDGITSCNPYKSSWSTWSALQPLKIKTIYNTTSTVSNVAFCQANLSFAGATTTDLSDRCKVYKNGSLIPSSGWTPTVNDREFRVVASGYNAIMSGTGPTAGLFTSDGTTLYGANRSYVLVRISRATGQVTFAQTYDVYGLGEFGGLTATDLANDLNATGSDSIVLVYTYDEPSTNRLTGGLLAAMQRCGASSTVFGSASFKVRSAYILVGIGGCGEGNGFEAYQGTVDDDVNSWCQLTFSLSSGQLKVTGLEFTPQTLTDVQGYLSDLNDSSQYAADLVGSYVKLASGVASSGDVVEAILAPSYPTKAELSFDPTVSDADPLKLTWYKIDTPYTVETLRNSYDRLAITNYYFWVKNKLAPATSKNLPVAQIASMLRYNDGLYCVPQVLKFYNQLDGRPNRYALLSVKNLGRYVKRMDTYKLRLTKNQTLRNDDKGSSLKNVHEEWILIRPGQLAAIPKALWDALTDTACGQNQLGEVLPYSQYSSYDLRNGTSVQYGLGSGQVMTDPALAVATIKYTIQNTKLTKDVNGATVPDYISYDGFSVSQIDSYFTDPATIRKTLSDIWRLATVAQVNEIFFAVLEDAAAKATDLKTIFKTSYISIDEVKTTINSYDTGGISTAKTIDYQVGTAPQASYVLTQDSSYVLQESGGKVKLQSLNT